MKIKDYFRQSFSGLITFISSLGKGLFFGVKRLFVQYPHPTYLTLIILLVAYHVYSIVRVSAQREGYNHKNVILQQKLDSARCAHVAYYRVNKKELSYDNN